MSSEIRDAHELVNKGRGTLIAGSMKNSFVLPLLLVLAGCLFVQSRQSTRPKTLVFTHVTVIDATGASPKPDMTVMTAGNRITGIGKTGGS